MFSIGLCIIRVEQSFIIITMSQIYKEIQMREVELRKSMRLVQADALEKSTGVVSLKVLLASDGNTV